MATTQHPRTAPARRACRPSPACTSLRPGRAAAAALHARPRPVLGLPPVACALPAR